MSYLLTAPRAYPVLAEVQEQLRAMPKWEQPRDWGWIMRTGELTGPDTVMQANYLEASSRRTSEDAERCQG